MRRDRCAPGAVLVAALGAALAMPRVGAARPRVERGDPRLRLVRYEHVIRNNGPEVARRVEVRIALPASSLRQEILDLEPRPAPDAVRVDAFGQRYALWRLEALPAGEHRAFGFLARVRLRPIAIRIDPADVGPRSEIPPDVRALYLMDGAYYRIDDPTVRAFAARADGAPTMLEEVRRLHDAIIDRVEYVRDGRWDPAPVVLRRGTGSCSEFNYAMVAACRARGIPARYAGGTVVRGDVPRYEDRIYHRWTEVYLPRAGWYPVDLSRDNAAEKRGNRYRYFGAVSWAALVMVRGGGGPLAATGWDYRSRVTQAEGLGARIASRRRGIWTAAPETTAHRTWGRGERAIATRVSRWRPAPLPETAFLPGAGPTGCLSGLVELPVER